MTNPTPDDDIRPPTPALRKLLENPSVLERANQTPDVAALTKRGQDVGLSPYTDSTASRVIQDLLAALRELSERLERAESLLSVNESGQLHGCCETATEHDLRSRVEKAEADRADLQAKARRVSVLRRAWRTLEYEQAHDALAAVLPEGSEHE